MTHLPMITGRNTESTAPAVAAPGGSAGARPDTIAVCLTAAAFFLPLKLSLAYPPLLCATCAYLIKRPSMRRDSPRYPLLVTFLGAAALCSLVGLNPLRSLRRLAGIGFVTLVVPTSARAAAAGHSGRVLAALAAGHAVAAAWSLVQAAGPGRVPRLFLGDVSEAGQLAMSLVVVAGLALTAFGDGPPVERRRTAVAAGAVLVTGILFAHTAGLGAAAMTAAAILLGAALAHGARVAYGRAGGGSGGSQGDLLPRTLPGRAAAVLVLPLMAVNSIVDMKRGPWAGQFVGLSLLLLLCRPRLLRPFLLATVAVVALVPPVLRRLGESVSHFFISGGRSVIWDVGAELVTSYPLGIGFGNSPVLRSFSAEIPPELRHFHDNLLNLTVECGWVAAAIAVAWYVATLADGFGRVLRLPAAARPGAAAVPCALVAWQVAGTVEYNVGDREVLLVALLLAGLASGRDPRVEAPAGGHVVRDAPPYLGEVPPDGGEVPRAAGAGDPVPHDR